MDTASVVTGTKLMNKSALIGDNLATPAFQPRSAARPGKAIMNIKCGLAAFIVSAVGMATPPAAVMTTTIAASVAVPKIQLRAE